MLIEKKGENQTKLTSISDLDLKGSVFGFVKEMLAKKRAEAITNFEKFIK